MMNVARTTTFFSLTLVCGLVGFASAAAADPLCKKLKSKLERDQCECSAATGGRVEEQGGKVTFQIPSRNQFPPWRACLVARGHNL